MAIRFRARLRFQPGSGMAQWVAVGRAVSWMDWYRCGHDQEPPELCPEPEWRWSQERSNGR